MKSPGRVWISAFPSPFDEGSVGTARFRILTISFISSMLQRGDFTQYLPARIFIETKNTMVIYRLQHSLLSFTATDTKFDVLYRREGL